VKTHYLLKKQLKSFIVPAYLHEMLLHAAAQAGKSKTIYLGTHNNSMRMRMILSW
jgi:hypothetical protein